MNLQTLVTMANEAEQAGFTQAGAEYRKKAALAAKLAVAYEHYRYVRAEKIAEFQARLKRQTERGPKPGEYLGITEYGRLITEVADQLVFTAIDAYRGMPPVDVFSKVKEAKERGCFDVFEVAEINPVATEVQLPDPIIFGLIDGCTDRFFIAEWGNDVSINDILGRADG